MHLREGAIGERGRVVEINDQRRPGALKGPQVCCCKRTQEVKRLFKFAIVKDSSSLLL